MGFKSWQSRAAARTAVPVIVISGKLLTFEDIEC
jgi:hypothetical protein